MRKTMTRREGLALVLSAAMGPFLTTKHAQASVSNSGQANMANFSVDHETRDIVSYKGVHNGKGTIDIKFFRFSGATQPANLLIYDIPPGASEGVHVHTLDNQNGKGVFDEYYYIISGTGQMEIDGQIVAVKAGDHIHTPLNVAHGIENTSAHEHLRVFLTFIQR